MKRPEFRNRDETPTADDRRHTQPPRFELVGEPDEPEHGLPGEVSEYTAFQPDEDGEPANTTEWISAAIGDVVPLGECR